MSYLYNLIVTQPIFNLLLVIYNFVGDFGVTLIIFTIITKLLLWPITKNQLHQTKLMRKLQPELKKIKHESKGNKQLETMRMLELYRENDVKPFRSMISLFIQIPIFFALIHAITITTNHQDQITNIAYKPVAQLSRIQDLSNSDKKFEPKLFGVIDLKEKAIPISNNSSIFLLIIAVLSAVTQWYVVKQVQPKKQGKKLRQIFEEAAQGKQHDQSELNQIVSSQMSMMIPVMMFIMMVNIYGALSFYYFLTNLIQILQQKYIFEIDKNEMSEIASEKIKNAKTAKVTRKETNSKVTRIKAKDSKWR